MTTTLEDNVKRRKPNASTVSKVLSEHGFIKSSPYTVYGYETPGFIVKRKRDGTVSVLWSYRDGSYILQEKSATAIDVLRAAGFNAVRDGRWNGYRPARWIKVLPWEEAA